MASPRPSSPVEDTPQSPSQLSPRSKIQAMLAAVDDSSDDDQPARSRPNRAALFKTTAQKSSSTTRNQDGGASAESSEEEEQIVRPRGRMAARMHTTTQSTSPKQNTESSTTGADTQDEESRGIQIAPRRRIRAARDKTPEPAADADIPSSPGLFVTPSPRRPSAPLSEDEEGLAPAEGLAKNDRFLALVARKRQEKEAKEKEEARKQEERARRMAEQAGVNNSDAEEEDDVSDIDDDAGGIKLTQQGSRPARKAGKKAVEEMNRETQRLARSLQLAHEAKTLKKLTKASLFERFNFRPQAEPSTELPASVEPKLDSSSRAATPNSVQQSDMELDGTPPSSPPSAKKPAAQSDVLPVDTKATSTVQPSEITATPQQAQDKGKGPQRKVRVRIPTVEANLTTIDSDDELEIIKTKPNTIDEILKKLPAKKDESSTSMTALMRLANLPSSPKGPGRGRRAVPSISAAELQTSLVQRARAQAKLERDRRLEELRAKGIHIQTEEERERQREEVEDMVAKARQEVEEIMQREREETKKERKEKKANGEVDPLAWEDSDDDSYDGSDNGELNEVELSGSEEEADDDEGTTSADEDSDGAENDGPEVEEGTTSALFENQAKEGVAEEDEDAEAIMRTPAPKSRRPRKHVQIVSDDEDDTIDATPKPKADVFQSPSGHPVDSPQVPTSVLRSATKTFIPGLPVAAARPAGLGMTQMFAGTMDDSQLEDAPSGSPMEFLPSLDNFPDSQFSATAEQIDDDSNMVLNSQPTQQATAARGDTQTQGVQLHFSQSQIHGFDSLIPGSQMSEALDLTQDGGYQELTPLKQRFVEPPQSTVETVADGISGADGVPDSPLVKRKGKLMRRVQLAAPDSTVPPTEAPPSGNDNDSAKLAVEDASASAADAFKRMEKAARRQKRLQARFDRKKSRATEMVEEQAEESEDEYAGLGGVDGEDSEEEDEELAKMMIDDAAGNDADEQQLAGLHAERARAADAAQVDKLFRDITTGMLRKRRRGGGNDFDLSDSDDDGQARRRMKRRQFAKMQKALFADERIGKIAENPRNSAFMKSIEDRDSDDEWDFDDNFAEETAEEESQSQEAVGTESEAIPESQPKLAETSERANLGRKRSRMDDHIARPAPNARRTKARGETRASSLADVQRSLSSLLEEPNASVIPATEFGSDSEGEEQAPVTSSNKENRAVAGYAKVAVVDRIALKRGSSNASTGSNSNRLAFASTGSASGGFKVPALLRRATTNSLLSSSSTSTIAGSATGSTVANGNGGKAGGFGEEAKLKKNAGKKSGVNYFARETERRAAVAEKEKKREAKKMKGVEGRAGVVGGLFGRGSFE
ncbi:MRC1-like domain-domain-containing protein [Microdochium bolleyi]|uniref:MRC1-like domain-domain-containing protein n=1 Tax=Microdochium bolleyi TaxID=196109 RepID=A0A136J1V0_9PEZI|nr:MRC1-like domain-domain-containing protein [Microdochium bolleyi]